MRSYFRRFEFFIPLIVTLICGFFIYTWYRSEGQASGHRQESVSGITEAIRINKADGSKSLAQLIRELPPDSGAIPDQAIKSFHFLVDPANDALMFPTVEGFQPPGFQWGVLPGQDKKITIPKIELKGADALNFFLVQTPGVCNFLLIIEFYPR